MAAGVDSFSSRTLWQFISGTGVLRPKELIKSELEINREKIFNGLKYYKKQSSPLGELLKEEKKVSGLQLEFTLKLGIFLSLDEIQSYDLFCSFLANEFRGSKKNLQQLLSDERHSQALVVKIRDYYFTERLYLLRCLRQVLSFWPNAQHPYRDVYATFLNDLLGETKLIEKLHEQFDMCCKEQVPSWESHGPFMNEQQAQVWLHQNLKEQCELLELMMMYYKDFTTDVRGFIQLMEKFTKHGFGWRQNYKHLLSKADEKLVKHIGFVELLILLDVLDIATAFRCKERDDFTDHMILANKQSFQDVDKLFANLGQESIHGPLYLCWALIRQLYLEDEESQIVTRKLGNLSLQLGVFTVLLDLVNTDPFSGNTIISSICQFVLYVLLYVVMSLYQEDSLGNLQSLNDLTIKLLKQEGNAEDLWQRGLEEGVGNLYSSAMSWFPLEFSRFIGFSISLASASVDSARKVKAALSKLTVYTEHLDNNSSQDLVPCGNMVFTLTRHKLPYTRGELVIPAGVTGQVIAMTGRDGGETMRGSPIVQWEHTYNGWLLLLCEVQQLLHQVSQGSGMVSPIQLSHVTMTMQLVKEVMTSDPASVPEFVDITNLCYQIIQRFSILTCPPVDLLGFTLDCLTCLVHKQPEQVLHGLKQTGFLPYLTESVDSLSEVLSGRSLSSGYCGSILASTECTQGRYPLTMAFLDMVSQLVQPLSKLGREEELQPSVLYILREVFPVYHKWRYYDMMRRESIGQKCLDVFNKIIGEVHIDKKNPTTEGRRLQEMCVYSLLFTEAGRALLDILATGVDSVEQALAQQGSTSEGGGIELIQLIMMSFSVLNHLLLLRAPDLPLSPTERALSSQPAGRQHQHIVATIAQYIYHRHKPRLPTLATVLLGRLALVSPMSILACLGSDAEPIKDMYLSRLQARSEDLQLKVAILNLLSVCVDSQPGLIEVFLNVQTTDSTDGKKQDLSLGKSSCLQTVLNLMELKKQGTYLCPPELLCPCAGLVHALWRGMRETAMEVLRAKESFWPSICKPLHNNINADYDKKFEEMKTASYVFKIIAQEIYIIFSSKLDENLKKVIQGLAKDNRLLYWSQFIRESQEHIGSNGDVEDKHLAMNAVLQLLLSWKNLLVTITKYKVDELNVTDKVKESILADLIAAIKAQFSTTTLTPLCKKLASVSSALYFTLLKSWVSSVSNPSESVKTLQDAVWLTCANRETLIPSVQIGLIASLTVILQHVRRDDVSLNMDRDVLTSVLPVVCSVLSHSTQELKVVKTSHPAEKTSASVNCQLDEPANQETNQVMLKLQIAACSLLVELIERIGDEDVWLPVLQQNCVIPTLLVSVEEHMKARQGLSYVHTVFLLLLTIANSEAGAATLALGNVTSHTCLVVTNCYTNDDLFTKPPVPAKGSSTYKHSSHSWHGVYCLSIELHSFLLSTLRYSFLDDALSFAGAHQERLQQCMKVASLSLMEPALREAESTCGFILQLSMFRHEWRFHLADVLNKLLTSMVIMCQTFIALLIRPRYLLFILERGQDGGSKKSEVQSSPLLQHQASTDDLDQPSVQLVQIQQQMLNILAHSLAALKQFTPELTQVMLDQSMDMTDYDVLLSLGFGTPAVDQQSFPTFGTLISCVTMSFRILCKIDPRGSGSPHRQADTTTCQNISKSLVLFILENALYIIMSQACRHLRDGELSGRDKQFLKRELGAELNSFLSSMLRYWRRGFGPTSPGSSVQSSPQVSSHVQLGKSVSQTTFSTSPDQKFFRLVQDFVAKVLR
ncbi:nucleoporin NUP188-like [Gigantopelta aegis]|uniref:nucleoporin NUP188-like n=1 Tax=Gigantopelta aegis TaxID=1735272 RepID=UPI001B88DDCE|nr:nucleoporin NUP188-like [Gigantopelta aegis]